MTKLIPYQGYVVPQEFVTTCNKCYERNVYQVQDTELDENINKRYFELKEINKLDLDLQEYEEFKLLEILIEMYERGIKYSIVDKKITVN